MSWVYVVGLDLRVEGRRVHSEQARGAGLVAACLFERAAIRKGYIALLCELSDRKIIGLANHKTNRDYLRALAERRPLYGEMQVLTDSFENHWYGYAPGTENDWTAFRMHYQRALKEG